MKCIWLRQDEIEKPEVEVAQEEKPQASVVGYSRPVILWSVSFASMAVCMVLWKSGKSELSISSIFLCIHLSICLFACLPIYSPDISYLSIDPSIYQSISLSINLPIYLSTYLSMYLSNLILFDPIWSYSILSDLILSNPIQVYLIPSNPIWSHLFPSDPIWSHLILSIPIYSYLAINQPTWYIQWMYLFVCRSV